MSDAKANLKVAPGPSRVDAVTQALRARYGNDLPEIVEAWKAWIVFGLSLTNFVVE